MNEQVVEGNKSAADIEEPKLTKLVQSTELEAPIQTWKLSNFAEEKTEKTVTELTEEVYEKMQQALQPKIEQHAEVLKKDAYDKAYAQGYEEGLAKGHEKGFKTGETEAREQVQQNLEPKIEQFESLLGSLQKPYELIEQKLYSEMVDLALHIAKTVVNKSVNEHKDWVLEAVHEAVSQLPESKSEINVYLNPDDLAFIQISKPTISEKWQLHENANLQIGTCLVKQDHSTVLNNWEARFDDIAQQISQDVAIDEQHEPQTNIKHESHHKASESSSDR